MAFRSFGTQTGTPTLPIARSRLAAPRARRPTPAADTSVTFHLVFRSGPTAEGEGGWQRSASLFRRHAHRGRFPAKDLPVQIPGLEAHRRKAPGGRGIGPKKRAGIQWLRLARASAVYAFPPLAVISRSAQRRQHMSHTSASAVCALPPLASRTGASGFFALPPVTAISRPAQ